MGNFYAGSTTIKFGRFTSFDPAEGCASPAARTIDRKIDSAKASRSNPKARSKPEIHIDDIRKSLIHYIIDQALMDRVGFKLPRNLPDFLRDVVSKRDNPIDWARQQPEFEGLWLKKSKKLEKIKNHKGPGILIASGDAQQAPNRETSINKTLLRPAHRLSRIRYQFLSSVVDAIVHGHEVSNDLMLPQGLAGEVMQCGGCVAWAREQPNYMALFQKSQRNRQAGRHTKRNVSEGNTVNHRSVKRKSRSDADLIQRGRTKVKIHNSNVAPDNVDEFYLIVGLLPSSSQFHTNRKQVSTKQTERARRAWVDALSREERLAWNQLSRNHQDEYLSTGRINIGTPVVVRMPKTIERAPMRVKPLNNSAVDHIIEKLNSDENNDWNIHTIDWDST
jgi:hypothetical protein